MSLKQQLFENNYVVIDNFITPEKAEETYQALKIHVEANKEKYEYTPAIYGHAYGKRNFKSALKLHVNKIQEIKNIVEEDVIPTYSYIRLYKKDSVLTRHIDRPSCEISVTVHLGSDGTEWPLGIKKPNGEEVMMLLNPGQAMVYLGCTAEHWREDSYKGDDYGQVFLHYVLADGVRSEHYFDRFGGTMRQHEILNKD